MLCYSLTATGKLVVATPQDSLLTKFGVTMSHAPFAGEVLVTTRTNQRFWFNKSESPEKMRW